MTPQRNARAPFFIFVAVLALLALIPVWVSAGFGELQPPDLPVTATVYLPTQSAYETRTAREEIEATSQFEVLPTEDYGAYHGGQAQFISNRHALGTPITPTPIPVNGSSALALQTYRCNYESDATGESLAPNTTFSVLGWNIDIDDQVYFLIEDDPTRAQVWVKADVEVVIFADYRAVFPQPVACRTWVLAPTASGAEGGTPSDIPLPRIFTATPPPPVPTDITYTNAEASALIAEDVPDLKNPSVLFSPEGVIVLAQVEGTGPLGIRVVGNLMVNGTLEIEEGKLVMRVSSVKLNDGDITDTDDGRRVETGVNNWLRGLMVRREVLSYTLEEGLLTVKALVYSESRFPNAATPTATETPLPETIDGATLTPTIPIPAVRSVTFTPVAAPKRDITSGQASTSARTHIANIQDIEVAFSTDTFTLTGNTRLPEAVASQPITLEAGLMTVNGQLRLDVRSLRSGPLDLLTHPAGPSLIAEIEAWLPLLSDNLRVDTFQLTNGVLKINP